MAVIKRGILGGFSNKIGNVVGSSWKGIAVIKSLPLSVANPNTVKQQNVRTRFTNCVALAAIFVPLFVKKVWNRGAGQMSGFNAFVKMNIFGAFTEDGNFVRDGLIISPSIESPQAPTSVVADAGEQTIVVAMPGGQSGNQKADDWLIVVVLTALGEYLGSDCFSSVRSTAAMTIEAVSPFIEGASIVVYVAAQSADGLRNFGQSYTEVTAIA